MDYKIRMTSLSRDQIEKLFNLAGVSVPTEITNTEISHALVELEKKLSLSSFTKSSIALTNTASILIIDDLEMSIHQLMILLTKCGYNVCIARNKEEATDYYIKKNFDYVILDLFLPASEDGANLLKTIKKSESTKNNNTKIVIISSTDDKTLINQCFINGADEFIQKSPEWHKNLVKILRQFESTKHNYGDEFITNIEDNDKKIMSIEVNNFQKRVVIEEIEKELLTLINTGYVNIIFDMKNLSSMDSRGVQSLILIYKTCQEQGGKLRLCNVNTSVSEVLSYVYLNKMLHSYPDKETALNSF